MGDRTKVTEYLQDKSIDVVLSSPYKRAFDTIADFADKNGFEIETIYDFRERKSDSDWISDTDFWPFIERQWNDFNYKFTDGECLAEVQTRNIKALNEVIARFTDKNIVIGTHGTALSTIINFYDSTFGFQDFMAMVNILPWVVKMVFDVDNCVSIEKIDIFDGKLTFSPLDVDTNRDFLFAAHRETSRLTFGSSFSDEQIEHELDRERGNSAGAYLSGKLVGICDVEKRSINGIEFGWVHFFYLMPELRQRGLGIQLIDRAINFCRESGLLQLHLRVGTANTNAYRFYERNGFKRVPELDRPNEYAFMREIAV
jgi:2,3-bisphosphoglycerate-dependent phosphoglycerate mutase